MSESALVTLVLGLGVLVLIGWLAYLSTRHEDEDGRPEEKS
jgi:hypothetical protein